ncbi:translation initiation factor 2 [Solibacillus sp. NPDC093137]|uniref:translation initiation factor 2 n=1 Tax=Solibacillus sp. NPDC093137 TaxID=3390678 RepID=UPI003CFC298C
MPINNYKNNSNHPSEPAEIQIARLGFIAATIVTLGDGLAALAAGLALQELEKANNQNSQPQYDQSKQIDSTQKQIDYLIKELKQIKKILS